MPDILCGIRAWLFVRSSPLSQMESLDVNSIVFSLQWMTLRLSGFLFVLIPYVYYAENPFTPSLPSTDAGCKVKHLLHYSFTTPSLSPLSKR